MRCGGRLLVPWRKRKQAHRTRDRVCQVGDKGRHHWRTDSSFNATTFVGLRTYYCTTTAVLNTRATTKAEDTVSRFQN